MCIRLNAKELLANILGSEYIKIGTIIHEKDFLRFQCQYDYITPGHIFFEVNDKDMAQAMTEFQNCCSIDQNGNIRVFSTSVKPDRQKYNCLLPEIVAQTLPSFADHFVVKLQQAKAQLC